MPLGPGPGASVVVRARVGRLGSLETIEAKGMAVGFVAKRVTEILGVDDVLAVTVVLPDTVELPELEGAGPVVLGLVDELECELELEEA
jgi:hypothetical protein